MLAILAVGVAYLLGSIPSAYLIGRWLKGLDLREAGDGRLGAALTRRRVGLFGSIIVAAMDFGKGLAAVMLAKALGLPIWVVIFTGIVAVVGHNWSLFLQFKGGKGAMTTYGVLFSLMLWPFLAAMAVAGIALLITNNKTGISTGVMFCFLALLNLFTGSAMVLVVTPILLSVPMVLKHITISRAEDTVMTGVEHQSQKGKL
ncbi:MAG: glycerol-3-phosphate acyltransferase [Dehalococcoidia bacterium]